MTSSAERLLYTTEAEFFAIPEDDRFHELLAGELVRKAMPSGRHGSSQNRAGRLLGGFDRKGDGRGPGGWRFATECEVRLFSDTIVRPDVAGWRRERLPRFPDRSPVEIAPDWTCEILSRSNAVRDTWDKVQIYHQAEIHHYWIIDPDRETLRVHRWTPGGYQVILMAGRAETVRAEPFELIEIKMADLAGDEG